MVSLGKQKICSKSDCEGIIDLLWLQPAFNKFPKIFDLNDQSKEIIFSWSLFLTVTFMIQTSHICGFL